MRFVDCIDIVGRKPDKYIGVKKYISTGAVGNNNEIIPTEIELYTYEDRPSRANLIAKVGNILFAKMADTKKVLMVDEANSNYLFSTGFFSIAPKKGILTSECLYYLLNSNIFQRQKDKYSSGATQKAITNKGLEKIIVNIPPKEKQVTISKELDLVISLINKYKLIITQLDNSIKARFIEMFGDPIINPMGWKETTVGEECYYIKDGPHKSLPDVGQGNGYPFISVRNIVNGSIDFSTAKYISEKDYLESIKKCHPQKGDILYSKGGTTGIAKLVDVDIKFANWVHVAVLKFDDSMNGVFFENMLNCDYCYDQSQRLTKGIANRDLVLSAMAQIKIYKPPLKLQKEFAAFVTQVDKSKVAVQKALDEAQLLFDSLMQKYFG